MAIVAGALALLVVVPSVALGADGSDIDTSPEASLAPAEAAFVPDFRVGDWDLREVPWKWRWLNGNKLLPARVVHAHDGAGVPIVLFGPDETPVYNPTVLAQQGMKRLDAYRRTGKARHRRIARDILEVLDGIATQHGASRWQPHPYEHGGLERCWVNANSHGLVLAFLSRYHELFGAPKRLDEAGRLLAAFHERETSQPWFATVTPAGLLWLEHWPGGNHVHTLNAHINALFGLYEYWLQTRSPVAEAFLQGGLLTVREKLERFRREGRLSRYSLSSDLGTVHYQHTHVRQLRQLARITGDDWFARQAMRLERDEKAWRANGDGRDRARRASATKSARGSAQSPRKLRLRDGRSGGARTTPWKEAC